MVKGYVDGFVLPVKEDRLDEYLALARASARMWLAHGALSIVEAVADDVSKGRRTSFPRAVDLAEDEVLVFATLTYRSREHRDEVNAKVAADTVMEKMMAEMPIAGDRMIWGGFEMEIAESRPRRTSRKARAVEIA